MSWWQRLWRRNQMEEQLDKEMRFHLERHIADWLRVVTIPWKRGDWRGWRSAVRSK